jgi:effector-binding domain-containing protein
MPVEPVIVRRETLPYAGIPVRAARDTLAEVVPGLLGELLGWAAEHSISPVGPPLIRYRVVDYRTGDVEADIAVPIAPSCLFQDERVVRGELPAGSYATVMHCGGYETLVDSTAALLEWGRESGVRWSGDVGGEVTSWDGRVEHYIVGPAQSPVPSEWLTEIAILVADV